MTSIKLKFQATSACRKDGSLYFQVIHNRKTRRIKTEWRIFPNEWDDNAGEIVASHLLPTNRRETLEFIRTNIANEQFRLGMVVKRLEESKALYSVDDIVSLYNRAPNEQITVFEYIQTQIDRLKQLQRERTADTYRQALSSFKKFRKSVDLHFDIIDSDIIERYERYMKGRNLCRNTTSFYIRILRSIYNRAVNDRLTIQRSPFRHVYTGIDKTSKRAIGIDEIKRIKNLDLTNQPTLELARDIFLFSFYMRGMSFIDIAYLRKQDLSHGYVAYTRKKTGQQLVVKWEKQMQEVVDKHPSNNQYMLPIIEIQDGTERKQYLNKMLLVNRKLKQIADMTGMATPLSMYVSRHSWASIARSKNISMSIISLGMGHENEETTKIYLASIQTNMVDDANIKILSEL